jgi:hypothetical protein
LRKLGRTSSSIVSTVRPRQRVCLPPRVPSASTLAARAAGRACHSPRLVRVSLVKRVRVVVPRAARAYASVHAGDLAVSRALGDFVYKRCDSVSAENQAVTAFPEIITVPRSTDDEFIVLACDGIWDVMSSQEVVEKVREMLLHGRPELPPLEEVPGGADEPVRRSDGPTADPVPTPPPRQWDLGAVAECLIDHCLRLGSRDNMSVIVLLIDQRLAPKPEQGDAASASATVAPGTNPTVASTSSSTAEGPEDSQV